MQKVFLSIAFLFVFAFADAQLGVKYDYAAQSTGNMQYFKPKGNLFVGDCIPFDKDGTYYYYWLLDSAHHRSLNGLGGHQWALSTTTDLKTWKQHPLVLKIDEPWEKSICTGSVVFYKGKYYAFYATRLIDNNGKVNEQLSYAVSNDGINFEKQKPNPFYTSAPGYSKRNFRDPKVFVDAAGAFHLFVSSEQEKPVIPGWGGALVHLSSTDLKTWKVHEPVLTGQGSVPECPDYFFWKGWYYLVFSDNGNTSYVMSKSPYGPWQQPRYQALNEDWSNVVKTAGFKNNRRIAAAWVPSRNDNRDNGGEIFGGNSLFREVTQEPDGTLNTSFPAEMIPATKHALSLNLVADTLAKILTPNTLLINTSAGVGAAHLDGVPINCRITMTVEPIGANEEFGVFLKSRQHGQGGYRLNFSANNRRVGLGNTSIPAVEELNKPFTLDIVMKDGIIDVDINHKRTIINRTYEQNGSFAWFFVKHGQVKFSNIKVMPLAE